MKIWTGIVIPFCLGISFFLIGMYVMRAGFQQLAGRKMEELLHRFTRTPTHGFLSGMFSTFILQSSTAITVLTIGLTNAGYIRFAQTIGIILGTNVGTTVTTQLIALRLEDLAVPLMLLGVALWLRPGPRTRATGMVIGGFGLLFMGVDTMQVMASPLQESETFRTLFWESRHSVWFGLVTGTLFSALIHSSSATIALTMGLVSHQVLSMDTALAIVLGANIGTCVTALIASIGTNAASRQVAWCHTLFNAVGAFLFLPLLPQLAQTAALLADDPATQIAHAQTIFNLFCSLVALPFANQIASIMHRLIREK